MNVSEPHQNGDGLWSTAVQPGRADVLLAALDPEWAHVLIETWDGESDWHEATVNVGPRDEPRSRVVRRHRFDLLVTPAEAIEIGAHLHAQGTAGGGLRCFQFRQRPPATFWLPDSSRGRAASMRGQRVELAIDLPQDGEVAVVTSPTETNVIQYVQRLV